jgi:3-phenylpropionate/trans-cinnamate dioxygenase ferredoxin reductase component
MTSAVIVGAGEAGLRVAQSLREEGFDGSVTLLGEEAHAPYGRPPLSKRVLTADLEFRPLASLDQIAAADIDLRLNAKVIHLDPMAKKVGLADGSFVGYDSLVLATGAVPRRLSTPGADEVGIQYLRTWDDATRLRAALGAGVRVAVVGAGFIGLELAAASLKRGATVTVVEFLPRVLGRAVPETLAADVADRHRSEGVVLLLGRVIERFAEAHDGSVRISLDGGEELAADVVIAGIGAAPESALAASAGLTIDNGIAVDEFLRTSANDVYAVGDACSFPHALYGGRRVRLEAWRNAFEQASHVAAIIAGTTTEPYCKVPWFWSDQYDGILQVSGLSDEGVTTVERPFTGSRLLFHLAADGRLVATSSWGTNKSVAKDARVAEMLIAAGARPNPQLLADPDVKMKSLLEA